MADEKKQVAREGKTWIEIILMPLVVALVGILGTLWITKEQEASAHTASMAQIESAKEAADADRQIKMLEIFSEKIASKEQDQRILALRILGAVEPELAEKLATAVADSEPVGSRVKETAQQVAGEASALIGTNKPTLPPPKRPPFRDVFLSQTLELPGHNFQTLKYQPVTSITGKTYQRGLFLDSQNTTPSSVSYRIPHGAKFFVATAIARDAGGCGGGGNVNGWTITITTPKASAPADLSWNYLAPIKLSVPVDNIPAGGIKELTITVNPHSDRTCDHPALADPHFTATKDAGV
jgi:hypothetical protein